MMSQEIYRKVLEAVANIPGCIMLLNCINPTFLCTGIIRITMYRNRKVITPFSASYILANCVNCGEVDIF